MAKNKGTAIGLLGFVIRIGVGAALLVVLLVAGNSYAGKNKQFADIWYSIPRSIGNMVSGKFDFGMSKILNKTSSPDNKNTAESEIKNGASKVSDGLSKAKSDIQSGVDKAKDALDDKTVNKTASESTQAPSDATSSTATPSASSGILPFKKERQLVLGNLDSLGRATDSHIQLKNSDEPTEKRAATLKFNPVGWHNYKFQYLDSDTGATKSAWLMNRGHLVGYQFCGLNDEPKNLVPETAYLNQGNIGHMDQGNKEAMLFYENNLDNWLYNHPNYYLDYQVTPIYTGDELVPRQVKLQYVGIDSNGATLTIKLGSNKEKLSSNGRTTVVLDNVSSNAMINYLTGTAKQK